MRMLITGICLAAAVLTASTSAAQERQLGLKAGPTFPGVAFDPDIGDVGYKRRLAVSFGGFVVVHANDRFAAQIEALFSPKGGKLTSGLTDATLTLKLDYVEIPILGRLTAARTTTRSFFLFAGPSAAIRTGAKLENSSTQGGFAYGTSDDVSEEFKRFDFALIAGAGMDFGEWLVIDGRYSWGLTDINRSEDLTSKVQNRALTFMGGVRF